MSGDTTLGALMRLSWLPSREPSENGNLIAGQNYWDVYFAGGEISNVTMSNIVYATPVPLSGGGTGSSLSDPGADRILFWDDSAGASDWLVAGSGLVITDKTISVAGGGLGDVTGPSSATDNAIARFNGTSGKVIQNSGATIDDSGNIAANNLSGTNTGDQTITLTGNVTGTGTGSFATTIANNAVTNAMLRDSGALSVIGRATNSTGDPADISAGSDNQVLRRSGTALAFGAVNLASSAAVTGALPIANGGTGATDAATARANLGLQTGWFNGGYRQGTFYYFGIGYSGTASPTTPSANVLYARPFVCADAETFTRVGIEVSTLGSGSSVRLGLYNWVDGVPTTLITDFGTVSTATTGIKEITISQALAQGVYGLAVVSSATPAAVYLATVTQAVTNDLFGYTTSSGIAGLTVSHTFGALPSSFGVPTGTTGTSSMPGIWMRKA